VASDVESARPTPKAFISYSWDDDAHKAWVREFATRLRNDGVDVTLDQWHLHLGEQLTAFMERSIRENDYVLIICTPFYADRSNRRIGGVGYEGDIMTAEVFTMGNPKKFIPIYRSGPDWAMAAPAWLLGKYRVDLRGEPYSEWEYHNLSLTLHGTRPVAPPVIPRTQKPATSPQAPDLQKFTSEPVRILGVIVDEVPRLETTARVEAPFTESRFSSRVAQRACGVGFLSRPGIIHPATQRCTALVLPA
jgi:hypothetical protein